MESDLSSCCFLDDSSVDMNIETRMYATCATSVHTSMHPYKDTSVAHK